MERKYQLLIIEQFLIILGATAIDLAIVFSTINYVFKIIILVMPTIIIGIKLIKYDYEYLSWIIITTLLFPPLAIWYLIMLFNKTQKNNSQTNSIISQEVKSYKTTKEYYVDLGQKIKNAKSEIYFQKYIFKLDYIGLYYLELLKKKASEGLKVTLVFDDLLMSENSKKILNKTLEDYSNVQIHYLKSRYLLFNHNLNFRNHRKSIIIDSKYYFVGGNNIGSEYLSLNPHYPRWEDSHFIIKSNNGNPLLQQLQLDAKIATKEIKINLTNNTLIYFKNSEIEKVLCQKIKEAKQKIVIQTPYVALPRKIINLLIDAKKRGVKISLFLPGKHDNKNLAYQITLHYANKLKAEGIDVYVTSQTFLHSKQFVVDDEILFGTVNFDFRSLYFNDETLIRCKMQDVINSHIKPRTSKENFQELSIDKSFKTQYLIRLLGIFN